jgi:hypothetical protein
MVNSYRFAQHRIHLDGTGKIDQSYPHHHAASSCWYAVTHVLLALSSASTSARSSTSAFTVSRWPSCEAMCSGVQSSCTGGDAECRRVGVSVPLFQFLIHATRAFHSRHNNSFLILRLLHNSPVLQNTDTSRWSNQYTASHAMVTTHHAFSTHHTP